MRAAAFLGVCVLGCATSQQAPPPTNAEVRTSIEQAHSLVIAAALVGNGDRVATVYTGDATVFTPRETLHGHAAIADYWRARLSASHYLAIERTNVTVTVNGDVAYETGESHAQVQTGNAPPQVFSARYLAVWQHGADGPWRIAAEAVLPDVSAAH